jgi:hypothetical protein
LLFHYIKKNRLRRSKKQARLSPRPNSNSPQENIWLALRATKEKAAQMGDQFLKSPKMAQFYNEVRTHFQREV